MFVNVKKLLQCIVTVLLCSLSVLACTSVDGGDPIGDSNRTAWTLGFVSAFFVAGTVAFYFLRRRKGLWVVILSLVLFALHPAWTVSAWIGDCGYSKVNYSKWFAGFLVLLTFYQVTRWMLARSRTEMID
jgi:hypothetical protein